jgi:hypothetical protein
LAALAKIANDDPQQFSLLNLESSEGVSRVTVSSGEVMTAAIESGFEVR